MPAMRAASFLTEFNWHLPTLAKLSLKTAQPQPRALQKAETMVENNSPGRWKASNDDDEKRQHCRERTYRAQFLA